MKRSALAILTLPLIAAPAAALNLSEANVMDVQRDGERFSVTLLHNDSGEEGYANRWEAYSRKGEVFGRRELAHPHGTRNFTRSERLEIPEEVDVLVFRGHDQTHGYGGRAAMFFLENDSVRFVENWEPEGESGSEDPVDDKTSNDGSDEHTSENNFLARLIGFLASVL